nr:MAG TPA: hypothetical protein [Caudoviricetes sp.]
MSPRIVDAARPPMSHLDRPTVRFLPTEVCCDPIWSRWPIGDPKGSGPRGGKYHD